MSITEQATSGYNLNQEENFFFHSLFDGFKYFYISESISDIMRLSAAVMFPQFTKSVSDQDVHFSSQEGREECDSVDSSLSDLDLDGAAAAIPDDFLHQLSIRF